MICSSFCRTRKLDSMRCFSNSLLNKARQQSALPWGFAPFRRFLVKAATNIEFTSLDCAPPSGFLNLMTVCSAFTTSALSRAESVHRVFTFRGFPLPVAATAFTAPALQSRTLPSNVMSPKIPKKFLLHLIGETFVVPAPKSSLDL